MTLILPQRGRIGQAAAAAAGFEFVGWGIGTGSTSNSGTTNIPSLSGGSRSTLAEGDLLLVAIGFVHTGNDENISVTDYTELEDISGLDTYDANMYVGYKVQGASPDTSISWNVGSLGTLLGQVQFMFVAFASADTPTSNSTTGNNSGIPDPPSITPTVAGSYVVNFSTGFGDANGPALANAAYDSVLQTPSTITATLTCIGAGLFAWTSGAFDAGAWSNFGDSSFTSWASANVVVAPAP